MRFTKQRTRYDCSQTFVANVLKALGIPVNYSKYQEIWSHDEGSGWRWNKGQGWHLRGTPLLNTYDTLAYYAKETGLFGLDFYLHAPYKRVKRMLQEGAMIGISYRWSHTFPNGKKKVSSHASLILGLDEEGRFVTVGDDALRAVKHLDWRAAKNRFWQLEAPVSVWVIWPK